MFLDQEEKRKLFRKISVRPCAKVMYTKTQERVEIIECRFFCLKGVYWESNEIFTDFAISRQPFDEIDSNFFILKVWTRK